MIDIAFIRERVQAGEYDLSHHAHKERQVEQITVEEIEKTLIAGAIIEKYPNDPRGESCLVVAKLAKQALHVVCGTRDERLLIVTLYRPLPSVWVNYKIRRKELKSRV